jgi:hypothetical protein
MTMKTSDVIIDWHPTIRWISSESWHMYTTTTAVVATVVAYD